ncbi:MAG: hypothetical protein ACYS8L_00625 [Planctomycetota bacterium]
MSSKAPKGGEGSLASCCGPASEKPPEACPCTSVLKAHRVAAIAVLAVMALAILISQVGGVLGIVAFLRTL